MKGHVMKRAARVRSMRRKASAKAYAASALARAARAAAPDLLPGAMDPDVDVPSDVDSVPSAPAAGEDLLAEVLGPRRVPLRGAARAQPLGAPPGARAAPPAPALRRSGRVIVPRAPSSSAEEGSEEEGSGPSSSSEDEGAFVRRRRGGGKRKRAGKGLRRPTKGVMHVHAYMRDRCLSRPFSSTVRVC